jgi:hypothetical protein
MGLHAGPSGRRRARRAPRRCHPCPRRGPMALGQGVSVVPVADRRPVPHDAACRHRCLQFGPWLRTASGVGPLGQLAAQAAGLAPSLTEVQAEGVSDQALRPQGWKARLPPEGAARGDQPDVVAAAGEPAVERRQRGRGDGVAERRHAGPAGVLAALRSSAAAARRGSGAVRARLRGDPWPRVWGGSVELSGDPARCRRRALAELRGEHLVTQLPGTPAGSTPLPPRSPRVGSRLPAVGVWRLAVRVAGREVGRRRRRGPWRGRVSPRGDRRGAQGRPGRCSRPGAGR